MYAEQFEPTRIPHQHRPCSIMAFFDHPLELRIPEIVILYFDGKPFDRWVQRGAFGDGP